MTRKLVLSTILTVLPIFVGLPMSNAQTESQAPQPAPAASSESQNFLGLTVGPTNGVRGVTVKAVAPGSPCEGVLKPGDTIFAVTPVGQRGARVNNDNLQAEIKKVQPGMSVNFLVTVRTPIREVTCTVPAVGGGTPPAAVPPQ